MRCCGHGDAPVTYWPTSILVQPFREVGWLYPAFIALPLFPQDLTRGDPPVQADAADVLRRQRAVVCGIRRTSDQLTR